MHFPRRRRTEHGSRAVRDTRTSDVLNQLRLRHNSLAELAYESIFELILSGDLRSGSELTTAGLAQQLDISRTPITEALQRLVADGILVWPKGRKARLISFDDKDIRQVFQVRLQLEALAAELAAEHMPEKLSREMIEESKGLQEHTGGDDWSTQCIALDLRLHQSVAKHSGNRWLESDILRILRLLRVMFGFTASVDRLCDAIEEHIPILDAIHAGDAAGARAAMSQHVEISLRVMLDAYETGVSARR